MDVKQLQQQRKKAIEDLASKKKAVASLDAVINTKKREKHQIENDTDEARSNMLAIVEKLEELQTSLEVAEQKFSERKVVMDSELDKKKKDIELAESALLQLNSDIDSSTKKLDVLRKDMDDVSSQLDNGVKMRDRLSEEIVSSQQKLSDISIAKKALEDKSKSLLDGVNEEVLTARDSLGLVLSEISIASDKRDKLEDAITKKQEELSSLSNTHKKLETLICKTKKQLDLLNEQVEELSSEIDKIEKQRGKYIKEKLQLETERKALRQRESEFNRLCKEAGIVL